MLLAPSRLDWDRAEQLAAEPSTAVYDDLGEQSVWRRLYPSVTELPTGYCTLRTSDLAAAEWHRVSILHDAHLIHDYHRDGWVEAGMTERVGVIDKAATRLFNAEFLSLFARPRPPGPRGRVRRGRGRAAPAAPARGRARAPAQLEQSGPMP